MAGSCDREPLQPDLLIDYSDGELEAELAAQVDVHLERCIQCRGRLVRLDASLSLASEVWEESARGIADVQVSPRGPGPLNTRRALLTLASAAAALLLGLFAWQQLVEEEVPMASGTKPHDEVPENAVAGTENRETPVVEIENSEQDLLALIDRVERRARLQVSLELLEQTPSLQSFAEQAEQYLASAYGELGIGDSSDTHRPSGNQEERL